MELRINNKSITFFNNFDLSLRFDAVGSAFNFGLYYNPDNAEHRELVRPGSYSPCKIMHNGETLITGTALSSRFNDSSVKELVNIGGYSTPGVLEDCQVPESAYPLQSDGLSLRQIARKLVDPFGLTIVVDAAVAADIDRVFTTSTVNEQQSIKSYLSDLAAQRNVVLSHTPEGALHFTRAATRSFPSIYFDMPNGGRPATRMELSFNGQQMHSSIMVVKQADSDGGNAGQATVTNPFVSAFRPAVVVQNSGSDVETSKAASAALAAELKNIVLTIEVDRWNLEDGLIRPNTVIAVRNPDIYINERTSWFVESAQYVGNNVETTATLTCVLPEVYNGNAPKNVFA